MTGYNFWRWLFKYSRRKFKEAHMETYKNDIRCVKCHSWHSVSGIDHKHEYLEDIDWGCTIKCGQCGQVSHYNLVIAPVAIRCDEKGIPL